MTLCGLAPLPQQIIDAASVIERAGFTIIDDLLHGYGGGYLPPVLGSQSRPSAHIPDEPLRAGMMVVIQPGIEPLHAMPRGFVRV